MKLLRVTKGLAVALACVGLVFPYQTVLGGEPAGRAAAAARIADVTLGAQGELVGRVVSDQNTPVPNIAVTLFNAFKQLGQTKTDAQGYFVFRGLRSGLYQIRTPGAVTLCRAWDARTAPPKAQRMLVVQRQKPLVRGQDPFDFTGVGGGTLFQVFTVGALAATITLSAVSLSKINDVEDEVAKIPKSP